MVESNQRPSHAQPSHRQSQSPLVSTLVGPKLTGSFSHTQPGCCPRLRCGSWACGGSWPTGGRVFSQVKQLQFAFDWPERPKTSTMNRASAERIDSGQVLGSGRTFVFRKTVPRRDAFEIAHEPVAGNLRQDTGSGNGVAFAISVDQGGLGVRQPLDPEPVNQHVLGPGNQLVEGGLHSTPGGLPDINPIDDIDIHGRDGKADFGM